MTFSARIEHTAGGLAITFAEPLTRLDMSADVAAHLAGLLAVEARQHRGAGSSVFVPHTEESQKRLYVTTGNVHPLCCDCEPCLNGDRNA